MPKETFTNPLSRRFFPNSSFEYVRKAVVAQGRLEEIKQEVRLVDQNFPEDLVEPTAQIVAFLELALDRTIMPFDGTAISLLDNDSEDALNLLGENIRGGSSIVVISQDRIIGRFVFDKECVFIDCEDENENPHVISSNGLGRLITSSRDLISKVIDIEDPQIVVINLGTEILRQ